MENTIIVALSGSSVRTRMLDVTANNIANMDTVGFRAQRPLFLEYLKEPDRPGPLSEYHLNLVTDFATVQDNRQGTIEHTGNPLDLAIEGDAYFMLDTDIGPRFSRAGRFELDPDRTLVDLNGLPVLDPDNEPIIFPENPGEITIQADGTIESSEEGQIGQIRLATFADPLDIRPAGAGLFVTNQVPEDPDVGTVNLLQGAVEASNVQPIVEMTRMIDIMRGYERHQNVLSDEDERLRTMIRQLGDMRA